MNVGIVVFLVLFGVYTVKHLQIVTVNEMLSFGLAVIGMTIAMFVLWRFVKNVEQVGFKRRVKISELREGDVLDDSKLWEGLTKEQVIKIKKSGKKHIVIKEGVRFAPTFPIALLVTVLLGDFVIWVVGLA